MKQVAGAHVPPAAVRPASMRAILSHPSRLAIWLCGSIIVRRVKATSAVVTGTPSDHLASGRSRKVSRSGPSRTSTPEGTASASWGTYRPFSFTVSRFCWMFVAMRWPTVEMPSASSTFRIGGAWYSASTRVPPRSGRGCALPEEPQPARRIAAPAVASAAAARTMCRRSPGTAKRRLPTCVTNLKRK